MSGPTTITLAGQAFEIQPLNLGQIEKIVDAIGDAGRITTKGSFDYALSIISAALAVSGRADLTPEALRGMMIRADEMRAAQDIVLRHSGLAPSGEAQPPAAGA